MMAPGKAEKKQGNAPRTAADRMADQQREISISEFFAKNRHLLGFDNKRKALLTTVKEAVDNSLDACEEARILPEISILVETIDVDRFRVTVRDNGPGIVKAQIPNVFGKLLYGSKFHRLKMSRGQQGIGISAAGMYGLLTTGKPVRIVSRIGSRAPAHRFQIAIDTRKNRADIIQDEEVEAPWEHGTEVTIELSASYLRGRQSVDEYLEQVAIANPHARIEYAPPQGERIVFERGTERLPAETREIKPHPHGLELGMLMKMVKETSAKQLSVFLKQEFCRVTPTVARNVAERAKLGLNSRLSALTPPQVEKLYQAMQETRVQAPPTDCLAPIGAESILKGLLKEVRAEFYTAVTRPPEVYRGHPFLVEVGIAYGGDLGADVHDVDEEEVAANVSGGDQVLSRVIRFANRAPLLYQQGGCALFKAVVDTKWNNYGLSQSSGALPRAPMVILLHLASVWVPFTSEGKEAIADYDEIRKEVKLAISTCGRRLVRLLRRKKRKADFARRRDVFGRYIHEVVEAASALAPIDRGRFHRDLVELSQRYTQHADLELDEHGNILSSAPETELDLEDTIVVPREDSAQAPVGLFGQSLNGDDALTPQGGAPGPGPGAAGKSRRKGKNPRKRAKR